MGVKGEKQKDEGRRLGGLSSVLAMELPELVMWAGCSGGWWRNALSDLPQYLAPSFENRAHCYWADGNRGKGLCVHTMPTGAPEPRQGSQRRHLPPELDQERAPLPPPDILSEAGLWEVLGVALTHLGSPFSAERRSG